MFVHVQWCQTLMHNTRDWLLKTPCSKKSSLYNTLVKPKEAFTLSTCELVSGLNDLNETSRKSVALYNRQGYN